MKIITSNVYAWNREQDAAKQVLSDSAAVVIGAQEAWRFGEIEGYQRCGSRRGGKPAQEVPIFLRDHGTRYLGGGAYMVKPDLGDSFTPERWITWIRFAHHGHRFAAINTHLDAALQNRETGEVYHSAARVEWAETHMRRLLREVRHQRRAGYKPIVTADFNYFPRKGQTELWRWSPHLALERARLHYEWHRLDGIGVPARMEHGNAHDFELPGSDHRSVSLVLHVPRKEDQ